MQGPSATDVLEFPVLVARLPEPPPAALDPVLDATVECVARHGLAKTSLSDIARELGVAPSTAYRKVGSVEHAVVLVLAREGHRVLARLPELIAGVEGPRVITVVLAEAIATTARHPMVAKMLQETDWVGRVATRTLEGTIAESAAAAASLLEQAMDVGLIRRQDPVALAHWLARVAMICLVAPPPGELLDALDHLLLPVLAPERGRRRSTA